MLVAITGIGCLLGGFLLLEYCLCMRLTGATAPLFVLPIVFMAMARIIWGRTATWVGLIIGLIGGVIHTADLVATICH